MNTSGRKTSMKGRARHEVRRKWVFCLLIPLLVLCVYGAFVKAPFVYDDSAHILKNRVVTSFKNPLDIGSWLAFFRTAYGLSNRPLLYVTYAWNYLPFGTAPAAFRATNMLIHSITASSKQASRKPWPS